MHLQHREVRPELQTALADAIEEMRAQMKPSIVQRTQMPPQGELQQQLVRHVEHQENGQAQAQRTQMPPHGELQQQLVQLRHEEHQENGQAQAQRTQMPPHGVLQQQLVQAHHMEHQENGRAQRTQMPPPQGVLQQQLVQARHVEHQENGQAQAQRTQDGKVESGPTEADVGEAGRGAGGCC